MVSRRWAFRPMHRVSGREMLRYGLMACMFSRTKAMLSSNSAMFFSVAVHHNRDIPSELVDQ